MGVHAMPVTEERGGDFESLFDSCYRRLARVLYRITGDTGRAEEIASGRGRESGEDALGARDWEVVVNHDRGQVTTIGREACVACVEYRLGWRCGHREVVTADPWRDPATGYPIRFERHRAARTSPPPTLDEHRGDGFFAR